MPWDSNQTEFCRELVAAFYARVPSDPVLSRLYPKHLKCAIDSLTLFLIQTLGGPCDYSERPLYRSLRESHQRFRLGPQEREAWLRNMNAALLELQAPAGLREYFEQASAYLIGQSNGAMTPLWQRQHAIEKVMEATRAGDAAKAIELAESPDVQAHVATDRCAWSALLVIFGDSSDATLIEYTRSKLLADPMLAQGKMLHKIGDASLIGLLIEQGADPNVRDSLNHPPLYFARRAEAVHALVRGGADVNARSGVQQVTALHMAARFGNLPVAQALLDCGADPALRDKRGNTPLERAINSRKHEMAAFLRSHRTTM